MGCNLCVRFCLLCMFIFVHMHADLTRVYQNMRYHVTAESSRWHQEKPILDLNPVSETVAFESIIRGTFLKHFHVCDDIQVQGYDKEFGDWIDITWHALKDTSRSYTKVKVISVKVASQYLGRVGPSLCGDDAGETDNVGSKVLKDSSNDTAVAEPSPQVDHPKSKEGPKGVTAHEAPTSVSR